jgi:hypothetical protein
VRDRGSATVEFALLLPTAVIGFVALLAVIPLQLASLSLATSAADLGRAVELGRNASELQNLASKLRVALNLGPITIDGYQCLEATKASNLLGVSLGNMVQKVCSLAPGK